MARRRRPSRLLSAVLFGLAAWPLASPMAAEVVHLRSAHDTTLFEDLAGSHAGGGSVSFFAGRDDNGSPRRWRGLVSFDVAGAIPRGSTITSVSLSLFASYAMNATPRSVELHRVSTAWGEGSAGASDSSGFGGNAAPGDATWVHTFFDTQEWNTRGGDFDISISAATVVAGLGGYTWESRRMRDEVQRWLDDPASNFGWLLRGDESEDDTMKGFYTLDSSNSNFQPVLTVQYTPPVTGRCIPDATTLCLDDVPGDQRFAARIHYASGRNGGFAGDAHAVDLANLGINRGGLFWFFSAANPEALIKVLNGCASNQHFWVFFSAATDVGLTLEVLDERTGERYQRSFPDGLAVPVMQEVNALPCG